MTTNTQLLYQQPNQKKKKKNLSKQLEQEQNHRNGGLPTSGVGVGRTGENAQGIRSINGKYKIDRRRLRIVWEM